MTYLRFPNVINHVRLLALQSVAINSKSLQSFLKLKCMSRKSKFRSTESVAVPLRNINPEFEIFLESIGHFTFNLGWFLMKFFSEKTATKIGKNKKSLG